jgi:hypothetical protein
VDATVDLTGGVPEFDWDFGTAYVVSVDALDEDGGHGRTMWHVQCGGDNLEDDNRFEESVCIETPIAYGERVRSEFLDSVNLTRAKALTPGETYLLTMATLVEDDGPTPDSKLPDWLGFLDRRAEHDDAHCGTGFAAEVEFVAGPTD